MPNTFMQTRTRCSPLMGLAFAVALAACGSPAGTMGGTGGAPGTGGATAAGGASGSGGATAISTGGVTAGAGGVTAGAGGVTAGAGGVTAGTGGLTASGGATGTAGARGSGGRAGGGGARGSGGVMGSAGAKGSGGATTGNGGASGCTPDYGCKPTPPDTGDYYADCVTRVNQFRACVCLPPLARWNAGEACADMDAAYDPSHSAHAGFIAGICSPEGNAQDECPGWGSATQVISGCIQQMFDEGPPPTADCTGDCYETHGHYINMTNTRYTKIACGIATVNGKVTAVQDLQ